MFNDSESLIKSIIYASGEYKLIYQGLIDQKSYTYDELLYMVRKEGCSYKNSLN